MKTLDISLKLKRYHCTVKRFVAESEHRSVRADKGIMRKVSARQIHGIKRAAAKIPLQSSKQLFEAAGASGVPRTSRCRILQRLAVVHKPNIQPPLNSVHKQKWLKWAQTYMNTNFQIVLFTDECQATLYGPDGWSSGWLVDCHHVPIRLRHQQGGGGVTFWARIMRKQLVGRFNVPEGIPLVIDGDEIRLKSQNILQMVLSKLYPSSNTLAHCGTTKVFLTHFMVDVLEKQRTGALSERALTIQCCWRRYRHRKLTRQRRAAIKLSKQKRMEALSAHELDDILDIVEGPTLSVEQKANGSSDKNYALSKPLEYCFVAQSWIFGFALCRAPPVRNMGVADGFNRHLRLLACLHILNRRNGYSVKANQSERGITSVRALPQGSVKFHYKRSPLQFAGVCPEALICGFNDILLEKVK
ncbi:unnamed protein product [Ranitomeya imitator]|uniref:Transposase n=1 Tax=Ranitomeya imitator TaxID=111125 RepID=A0ABN9KX90_9NEOB|nr:unnamed protein product [Ranitomeya imitator]